MMYVVEMWPHLNKVWPRNIEQEQNASDVLFHSTNNYNAHDCIPSFALEYQTGGQVCATCNAFSWTIKWGIDLGYHTHSSNSRQCWLCLNEAGVIIVPTSALFD